LSRFTSIGLSSLTLIAFLACLGTLSIPLSFRSGTAEYAGEHLESYNPGFGDKSAGKLVERVRTKYTVVIRDRSGAAVGIGEAARIPIGQERIEYVPLFPGIFEFASRPMELIYLAKAVAFLLLAFFLLFSRRRILASQSSPNQSTDPTLSSGTAPARQEPRHR
jgi:hypothetical protein